jgi:hypothetical protein
MEHLSNWHDFNPDDRSTYPKVASAVQVKFADGQRVEALSFTVFMSANPLSRSQILGWRYIKDIAVQ